MLHHNHPVQAEIPRGAVTGIVILVVGMWGAARGPSVCADKKIAETCTIESGICNDIIQIPGVDIDKHIPPLEKLTSARDILKTLEFPIISP